MENYHGFAEIYDQLMEEDLDYSKMADFVLKHASKGENYLDLGAGTASLSLRIAPHFKTTWLLDRSPEMLSLGVAKLEAAGITSIKAFQLSMEELSFPEHFTLVTSSVDSLNYILDERVLEEVFLRVFESLTSKGVFIFDLQSPYKLREILGNQDFVYTSDDVVYTWENQLEDPVVEMTLNFFVRRGNFFERFEEIHEERIYEPDRVGMLLSHAGFQRIALFDDYQEKPVSENTERIVFLAWKE